MKRTSILASILSLFCVTACSSSEIIPEEGDYVKGGNGKADSSAEAIFLNFDFDGSLVTNYTSIPSKTIEDQLLYTIGHLNGDRAVGRLDKLVLSDIEVVEEDNRTRINYHASLLVAWGHKNDIPATYELQLPLDNSYNALESFTEKYSHSCVDYGAHDVDQGSMWYYYRPRRSGCHLAADDVVKTTARVSLSSINTTGKYPEYHKVWEDDVLKVVSIFGKYEDGETSNSDAGISAYNKFVRAMTVKLRNRDGYQITPEMVPFSPGTKVPEVSFSAELGDGKRIEVVALLVDNIRTAPVAFNQRYEELSGSADLISYNGHAGLGANIREMARKGKWETGQYAIVFMNGCDTYAYVDTSLADAHAAVNSDDPQGTKYLDIVTNALPSLFRSMPSATMALVNGLLRYEDPMTFESMFRNIDSAEVVLVSGEQDNEYVPGFGEEPGDNPGDTPSTEKWSGLSEAGDIVKGDVHRFESITLPSGNYVFNLSGTGDADLYVRVGREPSTKNYDCRPYKSGSSEECKVEITTPAKIHVMIRGYKPSSTYSFEAKEL